MKPPFIGSLKECFYRFVEDRPGLPFLELIADFCTEGKVEVVQSWQRKAYFPRGTEAVRLASFLYEAGYRVAELDRISEASRHAALCIGFGMKLPEEVCKEQFQYLHVSNMWRHFLGAEGISEATRQRLEELSQEEGVRLASRQEDLREKLKSLLPPSPEREAPKPSLGLTPQMAAAFASSLGTTTALAHILAAAGEGQAARAATNNGSTIHELIALLQGLLVSERPLN